MSGRAVVAVLVFGAWAGLFVYQLGLEKGQREGHAKAMADMRRAAARRKAAGK